MTRSPSPEPTDPSSKRRSEERSSRSPGGRRRRLSNLFKATVGVTIALCGTVSYWRLSAYVHSELGPQVEATLLKMFDRPVEMGAVESFSPIGIRFGETRLPPTSNDRDQGIVEAVQVHFNPLELLFRQQLSLNITLVNPELLVDQEPAGQWVSTQINELEPGPIEIKLSQITLKNGTVALFPGVSSQAPLSPLADVSLSSPKWFQALDNNAVVIWQDVRGTVNLRNNNQVIELDLKSQLEGRRYAQTSQARPQGTYQPGRRPYRLPQRRGHLHLDGVVNLDQAEDAPLFSGELSTQRLPLSAIAPLATAYIPENWNLIKPENLADQGTTQGTTNQAITDQLVTDGVLNGSVRIQVANSNVDSPAAALRPDMIIWGEARINDGVIQLPNLPGTIHDLKGQFFFAGEQITLRNVRGRYGQIKATASGRIHLQDGYDIVTEIPSVSIRQILDASGLALPFEAKGRFRSRLKLTGALDAPRLVGTITNKGSILIDKLRLKTLRSRVQATLETLDINTIEALPKVGGSVMGSGQLSLNNRPSLNLGIVAQDLPGDTILRKLLAERISEWLPTQESGPGEGSRVGSNGRRTPKQRLRWLNPDTGQPITLGRIASNIQISGPLDQLQAIAQFQTPQATFPTTGTLTIADRVLSLSEISTQIGEGSINTTAAIDLTSEQWQGQVALNQLTLSQFPFSQLPWDQLPLDALPPNPFITPTDIDLTGVLDGQVEASGTFAAFNPEGVEMAGQLQLSQTPFINTPLSTSFQWSNRRLQIDRLETPQLQAEGWVDVPFEGWVPAVGPFDIGVKVQQLDLGEWEFPLPDSLTVAGLTDFDGRIFGTVAQPQGDGMLRFDGLTFNQIQFEPLAGPIQFGKDKGLAFDLRGDRDRLMATLDANLRPVRFELAHQLTAQTITRAHGSIDSSQGRDRLFASIEQFPLAALNLRPAEQFQLGAVGGVLNSNVAIDLTDWNWQQANPLDALDVVGKVAIAQPRLGYLTAECFRGEIRLANGTADLRNGQLRLKRYISSNALDPSLPSTCDGPLASNEGRYLLDGSLTARPTLAFNGQIGVEQGHIQEWLKTLQFFDLQDLGQGLRPAQLNSARDITPFPLPFARSTPYRPEASALSSDPGPSSSAQISSNTRLIHQLQRYAEIIALRNQQQRQQQTEFALPQLQDLDGTFDGSIDVALTPDQGLTAEFNLTGRDWVWGEYNNPNQLIALGEFANGTLTFLPLRFQSGDTQLNFAGSVGRGDDATGQFQATNISVDWLRRFFKLPLNIDGSLNAEAAITGNLQNPRARGNISLSNARLNRTPIQSAEAQFVYNNARLGLLGNMELQNTPTNNAATGQESGNPQGNENPGTSQDTLIALRGSLPYRFPLATVEPERDDIDLQIALKDDGIALMNLLNDQFFWEDGTGTITLDVGGSLRQTEKGIDFRPTIDGTALVESATFAAQALPEPLTNVKGDVQFDGDRITVNTFEGRFSDGDFKAIGIIPLLNPFTDEEVAALSTRADAALPEDPINAAEQASDPASQQLLSLALNDLVMNLKGVYNGGVDGHIDIRGTALAPELGGSLVLSRGRVSLPDPNAIPVAPAIASDESNVWGGLISPPELTDLKVTLGRDLLITQLPILNFVATGELNINGPLQTDMSAIAPEGTIDLRSGQVNLFTTQFNLDRSHQNTATFEPQFGTDPFLDVRLETSVLEDNRRRQAITTDLFSDLSRSEIADPVLGDLSQLQSIRIQAAVKGPASQLFNSIELTSSPSRSETEIVALMGGGFVDTQGRSEGFIGIANLAGTALFTSLQTLVSNAIGFSDFRIFPTIITNDQEEEGGGDVRTRTTLALAAELGLKLTDDLSVSALQLLTVPEPTQYNLRYQLSEELLLRGSTNFSDDNRIILEFETRF
ncbi:MAG: translocation/assembly module TamB domain-containing protein [Cyanobacteria bacterium P01_F01_bin.150]